MDKLTQAARSENMRRIKGRDTKPEMIVRGITHGLGFRYRLHVKSLPGKPDLVFPSRKKIIMVHGCFWHQHPDPNCRVVRKPKSQRSYWSPKLASNVTRDQRHLQELERMGWEVLTIWECSAKDADALTDTIRTFLTKPSL